MEKFYQSILQAKEYAKKNGIDLRDNKKFMGVINDLSGNSCAVECGWLKRAMERGFQLEFVGSSVKPINQKKQIVGKVRTKLISEEGFNDKAADTIIIALMMLGDWQEDYYRDFAVSYTSPQQTPPQQTSLQQIPPQQTPLQQTPIQQIPTQYTPPTPSQYTPAQKSNNSVIIILCVLIGIVSIGILWMSMQMRSQSNLASNSEETTISYDPPTTTEYKSPTTTTEYEPPTTTTEYEPPTTTEYVEPENSYQTRLNRLYEEYWSASDREMGACYNKSDNLLNEIYQEIKSDLGKESSAFQSLRLDELDWIDVRDAAANSSSNYMDTMTEYTLERCQYLLDCYY
ncbi:MAG: lysozyme inhibitor LprI family protein [Lachnospiraceae bacterium]